MQIARTWRALKRWHIQLNIINKATVLAAQKDPEKDRKQSERLAFSRWLLAEELDSMRFIAWHPSGHGNDAITCFEYWANG